MASQMCVYYSTLDYMVALRLACSLHKLDSPVAWHCFRCHV